MNESVINESTTGSVIDTEITDNVQKNTRQLTEYSVWDRTTRWFHWLNVICILLLAGIGLVILNGNSLDISSEAKIDLKIMHAWVGYVFTVNLLWRFLWGFAGNRYARWSAILPFGKKYRDSLKTYTASMKSGEQQVYRGHNPLARIMVAFLLLLLSLQMVTGLVLAGTDLYFPPFGHEFAEWATGAGEDHSQLVGLEPGAKEMLDPEGYAAMRQFREPFITIHKYSFFVLLLAIAIHISAVVVSEVREKNGLVSAMFSGRKVFSKTPED